MIKVIKTKEQYSKTLARIDELMSVAKPNTPQGDELELLMLVVEAYEKKHYQIPVPSAIEAIRFRMEQEGLLQKDLIPFIGDKAIVSKVLRGERGLTLPMIRNLNQHLQIPLEALVY